MDALRNQIYIGDMDNPYLYLENDEIVSISGEKVVTLSGDELAIDTFSPEVSVVVIPRKVFKPTDYDGIQTSDGLLMCGYYGTDIRDVPYGTPVYYYNDNNYIATYYLKEATREGTNTYKLDCVSIIGLLDMQYHAGGVYDNETFENILKDILNVTQPVIPYVPTGCVPYQSLDFTGSGNSSLMSREMTVNFTYNCKFKMKYRLSSLPSEAKILFEYVLATPSIAYCAYKFDIEVGSTGAGRLKMSYVGTNVGTTVTEWYSLGDVFDLSEHTIELWTIIDGNRVSLIQDDAIIWAKDDQSYEEPISVGDTYKRVYVNYDNDLVFKLYSESVSIDGTNIINYIPCMTEDKLSVGFYNSVDNPEHTYLMYSTSLLTIPVEEGLPYVDRGEPFQYWDDIVVDDAVKDIELCGWLPYDTCRNNLHQLMFALNVIMLKSDLGKVLLTFPVLEQEAVEIADSDVFEKGSVSYTTPASKVEVTEHVFKANSAVDSTVLYDNTGDDEVEHELVKFSQAPVDPTTKVTTGQLDVEEMGVNYAVVSGRGTLSAKPYVHNKKIVKKVNKEAITEHIITCSDATLVSSLNSQNVAKRLLNFYMADETVKAKIIMGDRKCGNKYTLTNRFGEQVTGYLNKVSFSSTSFMAGDCEFITEYEPSDTGNNYEHSVMLTGSGTWVVPTGVTQIRVAMISGGQGGASGYAGTDSTGTSGGRGGRGGIEGNGGRVRQMTIGEDQPYPLASSYSYSCGVGGNGGAQCSSNETNNAGSLGTDTVFGSYSTEGYATQVYGFTDIKTGMVYAMAGTEGADGGDGGKGDRANGSTSQMYTGAFNTKYYCWQDTDVSNRAEDGEDVEFEGVLYNGGKGIPYSENLWDEWGGAYGEDWTGYAFLGGGGGGGACAGKNGTNGSEPVSQNSTTTDTMSGTVETILVSFTGTSGNGGNGVTPDNRASATVYGNGGDGGHGGGGAGAPGKIRSSTITKTYMEEDLGSEFYPSKIYWKVAANMTQGVGGSHGLGGAGGKGGNGCIIIQY